MHKATLISVSPVLGERVNIVEHEDIALFYATLAGTVEGLTAAGSVVTSVVTERSA